MSFYRITNGFIVSTIYLTITFFRKEPKQWDRFIQSSEDNFANDNVEFWNTVFIVTKIILAVVLFFLTLATAVVSKVCFVIITANIYPVTENENDSSSVHNKLKTVSGILTYHDEHTNVQWIWALILLTGAPYLFTSLKLFWRLFFQLNGSASPDCLTLLIVGLLDRTGFYRFGTSIFLPNISV